MQLNGSTAAPRPGIAPNHMELRPTMTEISAVYRGGSLVSNVSPPVGGGANVGGTPSDGGIGVGVLVGAKYAAGRSAASPELAWTSLVPTRLRRESCCDVY